MQIKTIRRISQLVFFVLLVYGGFVIAGIFGLNPQIPRGMEGERSILDSTLPVRSCRYMEPKPTFFESCTVKFLLERPLYGQDWMTLSFSILIILILFFAFGRFLCGWTCPLGFITEMLDELRQKVGLDKIILPPKLKKALEVWRYSWLLFLVFLSFALVLPFLSGLYMNKNIYQAACQACPARMIFPLFGGSSPTIPSFMTATTSFFSILSIIFLLIYLSGLFITRAWCRICPNGSLSSLFNQGALVMKYKEPRKCTRCGICKRVCPFDNTHVYDEKDARSLSSTNCIMCLSCVDNCPEKDCLKVKVFGKELFRSGFKRK